MYHRCIMASSFACTTMNRIIDADEEEEGEVAVEAPLGSFTEASSVRQRRCTASLQRAASTPCFKILLHYIFEYST